MSAKERNWYKSAVMTFNRQDIACVNVQIMNEAVDNMSLYIFIWVCTRPVYEKYMTNVVNFTVSQPGKQ